MGLIVHPGITTLNGSELKSAAMKNFEGSICQNIVYLVREKSGNFTHLVAHLYAVFLNACTSLGGFLSFFWYYAVL